MMSASSPNLYGRLQRKKLLKGLKAAVQGKCPLHRLGLPEEMPRLPYSWLRRRAATSPGSTLPVDGGLVAVQRFL